MSEYITVATLADRLNVHQSTVWRLVAGGTLPLPIYVGSRSPRWEWGEVAAALTRQRMPPRAAAACRRRPAATAAAAE